MKVWCKLFGYVEPDKPQLRLCEYEQYRALYCGLCRSMGKHTGSVSRLTLNYDYVFLAMIRSAMLNITPEIVPSRCALHPLKKRAIARDDAALEYCAKISAILSYHKILDDIADCHGAKRLGAMAARPIFSASLKKCEDMTSVGEKISDLLCEMSKLEKSESPAPDMLAEYFGSIMGELFAFGLENEANARIARELGRHTGRYIYFADALDDICHDIKSGEFNPFVSLYKDGVYAHTDEIKTAILLELSGLEAALALVDFSSCPAYGNIVNNIIYLGMPRKIEDILEKTAKKRAADQN